MLSGWKKDKKPLKGSEKFVDEEKETFLTKLTVSKATKSHAGLYTCEIANKIKKTRAEIWLVVEPRPQKPNGLVVRLLQGKKLLKKIDDMVIIDRLDDFRIDYAVKGHPIPTATWFKDGKHISKKEVALSKKDIENHAGKYEIVVENNVGKVSQIFEVRVKLGPRAKHEKLYTHEIEEGQLITLKCAMVGHPEPEISWMHDGDEIISTCLHKLEHQNKVLRFKGDEDLSGNYTCVGTNNQGQDHITFMVAVKGLLISF